MLHCRSERNENPGVSASSRPHSFQAKAALFTWGTSVKEAGRKINVRTNQPTTCRKSLICEVSLNFPHQLEHRRRKSWTGVGNSSHD